MIGKQHKRLGKLLAATAAGLSWLAASFMPTSAQAGTFYGGGDTFLGVPYLGDNYLSTAPYSRFARYISLSGATAGSGYEDVYFGNQSGGVNSSYSPQLYALVIAQGGEIRTGYCQTSVRFAKDMLLKTGTDAQANCTDFSGTPEGFSGTANYNYNVSDYVGTGSPLSVSDVSTFESGRSGTTGINQVKIAGLVQVPVLAGNLMIPVNLGSSFTGTLNLSSSDVCLLFSGAITQWSQLNSDDSNLPTLPDLAVTLVYRSDASGDSFALSNWLARNCNAANGGSITADDDGTAAFLTSEDFSDVVSSDRLSGITTVAEDGSANLVAEVMSTEGAFGYADPGVTVTLGAAYAWVDGYDPAANASTTITLDSSSLLENVLVGDVDTSTGLLSTSTTVGDPYAIVLVDPATRTVGAYPLVEFAYMATYTQGLSGWSLFVRWALNYLAATDSAVVARPSTLPPGYFFVLGANDEANAKIEDAINSIVY